MLIYGILYVSEVLGKIRPGMARREAEKVRRRFRLVQWEDRTRKADTDWIGRYEPRARHQLCDPGRCGLPPEPGLRGAAGQELSRGAETIHYADATGAGDKVAE